MTTPIKRRYTISDYSMVEYSKALRTVFLTDQTEFVSRDPDFANPFEDDWQDAIDEAEAQLTDEVVRDQLQDLTQ